MTFEPALIARAADILLRAQKQNLKIATAESCTGGLVAALFTEIPGSSATFDRGFVVYSNAAKHDMLGVPVQTIDANGAVSPQTAQAVALHAGREALNGVDGRDKPGHDAFGSIVAEAAGNPSAMPMRAGSRIFRPLTPPRAAAHSPPPARRFPRGGP